MIEPTPSTKLIAYSSIGIVGVIGNLLVLLSISQVTNMPKLSRKFIQHLAIVDLIINVVVVPCKLIDILYPDLSDHPYLVAVIRCKAMPYVAESLFAALINTLVALTIDRYIAIVHPLTKITKRQYRGIISLIWSYALIFSIPEMLVKNLNKMKCELTWPLYSLRNVYYGFDAAENCIVPVCIVVYCYARIWRIVKRRRIPGERIGNERINERMERNRIKIMKIIFVITMYFIMSGVPLYIAFFTYEFSRHERNQVRNHTIHFWLDWLALTHLFMNPFLYCMMSTRIRNIFKNFLKGRLDGVANTKNVSTASASAMTTVSKTHTESAETSV